MISYAFTQQEFYIPEDEHIQMLTDGKISTNSHNAMLCAQAIDLVHGFIQSDCQGVRSQVSQKAAELIKVLLEWKKELESSHEAK